MFEVGDMVRHTIHTIGRSEPIVARVVETRYRNRDQLLIEHEAWGRMVVEPGKVTKV